MPPWPSAAAKSKVDPFWKAAIWSQFGAALDMLENAIRACPDGLWSDPSKKPQWRSRDVVGFWYVVFHTIFFLDFYMSDSAAAFLPPAPFTLDELDPAGLLPDRPYTKEELLKYLDYSRAKARAVFDKLTGERVELLLSQMRHLQHHAGQLHLLLRQNIDSAPRWVRAASVRM